MSKPSKGRVQVSFCVGNLSWIQALHSFVIRGPRDRLLKRSQGSSAAPSHSTECFLSDRVTTRAWQIQDLCWLSGTCQWAGSSSEFRNSLPSPAPQLDLQPSQCRHVCLSSLPALTERGRSRDSPKIGEEVTDSRHWYPTTGSCHPS